MKLASVLCVSSALVGLSSALSLSTRVADVNPFAGHNFFVSPVYAKEIAGAIVNLLKRGELSLAAKALKVAQVSTFIWISDRASVSTISGYLREASLLGLIGKPQVVQLVVYDLPDRDCSAGASDGEFHLSSGGEDKYKEYIRAIRAEIQKVPSVKVVIALEPDSIGNLVTNLAVPKCANAGPAYQRLLAYAVATLQLPNVSIYIDAAHAGWLGWPDNLAPTAKILGQILTDAKAINPASAVRGVVTDVSNYNGLGNQPQVGSDELVYAQNLAPYLQAVGYPAHFIVDQGRSGNQVAARSGGDWCNFKNAGFGPRPSTNTPSPLIDAIVWVKPGGEGDGTSNSTAARYDPACGSATSLIPAPEAGTFFQAYFELLIKQANPPF